MQAKKGCDVPTLAFFFLPQILGFKAASVFNSFESAMLARLVSHASETSDSLSSIRAYGVADRFCQRCFLLRKDITRANSGFDSCYRLVRNSAGASGFLVVLGTIVVGVLLHPPDKIPSPSTIGLVLSAATSVNKIVVHLNRKITGIF